jgi:DNA segregation ATPase FtsK/SpoIIIE-like protein
MNNLEHFDDEEEIDDDFRCAKYFVVATGKASISSIQSQFYWGYIRARKAFEELEKVGIIGPQVQGERYRKILIKPED